MKIALNGGKPASEETLAALEVALGCQLSNSFKRFVRDNNGAKPEPNIFRITDRNESGVIRFIPVSEISSERAEIENIPDHAYPVAWAECGNYVFIDEKQNGNVFFWDHEVPEDIVGVAPNFDVFLDLLQPFDIESIELKPGQVKKVWIDAEFLKRLNEKVGP